MMHPEAGPSPENQASTPPPLPGSVTVDKGPWPFWVSFGLMIGLMMAMVAAQVVAVVVLMAGRMAQGGKVDPEALQTDGLLVSLSMVVSTPVVVGLCWLLIHLRRGPSLAEYLGLRGFGWKDAVLGLVGLGLVWGLGVWICPEPSDWMIKIWHNRGPLPLFLVAIVVLAPVVEEVLFRGFAFAGLSTGRTGAWGATVITTLAWSSLHLQYGWRELTLVFGLGLVLGWMRARSGSLWLAMGLHALNNALSTLAMLGS